MSFWKNLFGGGGGEPKAAAQEPGEEYKGFIIRPTPMPVGSEYQLSGRIEKEIDGELKIRVEFVDARAVKYQRLAQTAGLPRDNH